MVNSNEMEKQKGAFKMFRVIAWRSRLVQHMQQVVARRSRLVQLMQQFCNVLFSNVTCIWPGLVFGVWSLLPLLEIQAPNSSLLKTLIKQFENFVRQVRQFFQIKERFIVTYKSCCLWNEAAEFQFPSWRLYLLNLCNMFVAFSLWAKSTIVIIHMKAFHIRFSEIWFEYFITVAKSHVFCFISTFLLTSADSTTEVKFGTISRSSLYGTE